MLDSDNEFLLSSGMQWSSIIVAAFVVLPGAAASYAAEPSAAVAPSTQSFQALHQAVADPAFAHGQLGVCVERLDTHERIFARHAEDMLVPASNVKLFTTAAALDTLGPDFQFQTEVYGALDANGCIAPELVLKGYGDPYLIPERMHYLAERLVTLGIQQIKGDILVDDSYFSDEAKMAIGWGEDRSSRAYMAPAGALSVGFNAMMVHVLPARAPNLAARILLDPQQEYAHVAGTVMTVATGPTRLDVDVSPYQGRSIVRVSGTVRADDATRAFWRRVDEPALFAGEVLAKSLSQSGISFSGTVKKGSTKAEAPLLLSYASPRLAELLVPLNKYSNNFMAMQLALTMGAHEHGAPATWPKAKASLQKFMRNRLDIKDDAYVLNNASGLHSVNRFSPAQIVKVLSFMHAHPTASVEFVNSLATAAGSGTLQDRMLAAPAAHHVRAKTGTLTIASALSGYVTTATGVPLAFSLLLNGYRHVEDVWQAQDKVAAALAVWPLPPAAAMGPTVSGAR